MFVPVPILLLLMLLIGLGLEPCGLMSLVIQRVGPRQILLKILDELLALIVVADRGSISLKRKMSRFFTRKKCYVCDPPEITDPLLRDMLVEDQD